MMMMTMMTCVAVCWLISNLYVAEGWLFIDRALEKAEKIDSALYALNWQSAKAWIYIHSYILFIWSI